MSDDIERLIRWPERDAPGRFLIHCSCLRWEFTGTAEEIHMAAIKHDDAPWQNHVVHIVGKLRKAAS